MKKILFPFLISFSVFANAGSFQIDNVVHSLNQMNDKTYEIKRCDKNTCLTKSFDRDDFIERMDYIMFEIEDIVGNSDDFEKFINEQVDGTKNLTSQVVSVADVFYNIATKENVEDILENKEMILNRLVSFYRFCNDEQFKEAWKLVTQSDREIVNKNNKIFVYLLSQAFFIDMFKQESLGQI